ncbi:hypothetical protein SCLCIDRAFT_1211674 [Scleroderma citrinum Foug A]|uniref:FAS1 domain-containing protein n=1 Tax=Scleroderma citrinum Foug A TaxID=1036808 RepID=A0A0C3EDP1_9AGAM|nr:hypothetical protein SCLCIDRAFT_1211674 [Scleroderma citrinum Foug A]
MYTFGIRLQSPTDGTAAFLQSHSHSSPSRSVSTCSGHPTTRFPPEEHSFRVVETALDHMLRWHVIE